MTLTLTDIALLLWIATGIASATDEDLNAWTQLLIILFWPILWLAIALFFRFSEPPQSRPDHDDYWRY